MMEMNILQGDSVGLMAGAVNGMVERLVQTGFTPSEGFCLAQAAYIKEHKRDRGVPPTVLDRKAATWEINEKLRFLGAYPQGAEAHRIRIILWETVFGRGSWHEPINQEDIYGRSHVADAPMQSPPPAHPEESTENRKAFQFTLPGDAGLNFKGYAPVLVMTAESELISRMQHEGYLVDSATIQSQVIDLEQLRAEGRDTRAAGFSDDTYLAAHVTGEGVKFPGATERPPLPASVTVDGLTG